MANTRPTTVLAVSTIFFIVVTTLAYYKENGLQTVLDLGAEIENLNSEMSQLKIENRKIEMERASLVRKGLYVEAIAREDLGLVKPGEVVYEFIDAKHLVGPQRLGKKVY